MSTQTLAVACPVTRHSSVDDLKPSPGNSPISMSELWEVAYRAYQVVWSAYEHIEDKAARTELDRALDALMSVRSYTHNLRMVYEVAE